MPQGKPMTEEHKATLMASAEEARELKNSLRSNRLEVGKWCVYWFDDYNFVVEPIIDGEAKRRYFPDYKSAVCDLHRQILTEHVQKASTLNDVIKAIKASEKKILDVLQSI